MRTLLPLGAYYSLRIHSLRSGTGIEAPDKVHGSERGSGQKENMVYISSFISLQGRARTCPDENRSETDKDGDTNQDFG